MFAQDGGIIRATNGNSSYGDFGAVAEGVDDRETPNSAIVDNRLQFEATIDRVITDGSALYQIEFIKIKENKVKTYNYYKKINK
jgi:hypothetical protein